MRSQTGSIVGAIVAVLLALSACGSDSGSSGGGGAEEARTVEVIAKEYTFNGDPGTIAAGDTIEFVLANEGMLDHSMEVLSAEGRSLGKIERIVPGATGQVTVTFDDAGQFRLICDIDDHLSRGQSANLTVIDS